MLNRRDFAKLAALVGGAAAFPWRLGLFGAKRALAQIPGGSLAPGDIEKFVLPLVKPPAMPKMQKGKMGNMQGFDYYEIAVRQFQQRVISPPHPMTTVWSYGSIEYPGTVAEGGTFNYPAFTIEAPWDHRVRVNWINDLVAKNGRFLPHLLSVDQTLHWANPPGGKRGRDKRGYSPYPYEGPVPIVTHVHGAHTHADSDGYTEAWFLPDAKNIPNGYAKSGTFYDYFRSQFKSRVGQGWDPGTAVFEYPNDQPATTLWYHDHALGMTRLNVYAGPAGYWLIRGGPNDTDLGYRAPGVGDDPLGEYTEIPIVIQDRSFNADGSLFYPDNRAFFEGLNPSQLQIPFIPEDACDGKSDVSPIWNPEFFGNTMVVNGFSWPYLEVEQRRYRFRFLNGCNSRFLILKMSNGMPFYQIGGDQGFLPRTVELNELLLAPAERADVIVDFSRARRGTEIILQNFGPDEPFGGGLPGVDFDPADPDSTGQVMQFRVKAATSRDTSILPTTLPAASRPGDPDNTRAVSLNEEGSATVRVSEENGNIVLDCAEGEEFGPTAALLGTYDGSSHTRKWADLITENPDLDSTEQWEIHNFTEDAHPIHIHQVHFQVVSREDNGGNLRRPEAWETGYKDTVIAYPGEITRVKAKFDLPGYYVWHCHIVEHEDNEMMRPFHVGPIPSDGPAQ